MVSLNSQIIKPRTLFLLAIIILVTITNALCLTTKERWAKDNYESLTIRPAESPVLLNAGGPDGYGYFYYDSQDSATNAPDYHWINITGDSIINFYEDDQILGPYNIGFPFTFYGLNVTSFRVCSNGWISFNSLTPEYQNRPIPTSDEPNSLIAVYWDDLVPDSSHAYYYTNNDDTCIVAWHNFRHYPNTGIYTFEVILTSNNGIVFQYQQLNGTLDSHTIGIENSSGSAGLQYIYNSFSNETGRAIYFGLRPPHYVTHDVMPSSFRGPSNPRGLVGSQFVPSVRFTNAGSAIETFDGRVRIFHNSQQLYNQTRRISNLRSDSSYQTSFLSFTPTEAGSYQLIATSELSTDLRPRNDTISISYYAYSALVSLNFEANAASFLGNHDWQWGVPTHGPSPAHSGTRLWATKL
ncbi:MAG TPA: hypothetical protein DEO84_07030, partial [candidate division Zixibacteria bacterium]|nr:hypothetical protein [candidate division Zixibacteria bacterium]